MHRGGFLVKEESGQPEDFDHLEKLTEYLENEEFFANNSSKFHSGADGEDMSWDAVKEKLKAIIENEDKHNPLNDDEIVVKLKEQGIENARRTVAKYRKILNIAPARQRREF
jgi:RNA polymerase sigma-54 factor